MSSSPPGQLQSFHVLSSLAVACGVVRTRSVTFVSASLHQRRQLTQDTPHTGQGSVGVLPPASARQDGLARMQGEVGDAQLVALIGLLQAERALHTGDERMPGWPDRESHNHTITHSNPARI